MVRTFFMVLVSVLALSAMSGAAKAQDLRLGETGEEKALQEAQNFYNQCMADPIMDLSELSDKAFCACGAASLQAWMEAPAAHKPGAEFLQSPIKDLDKMTLLTDVYGPCLYIAVYELSFRACITDDDQAYSMKTNDEFDALCHCMAAGDEAYFRDFAQPYLAMRVADGKTFDNPIREVKRSTDFYTAHFRTETNCHQDIKRARGN